MVDAVDMVVVVAVMAATDINHVVVTAMGTNKEVIHQVVEEVIRQVVQEVIRQVVDTNNALMTREDVRITMVMEDAVVIVVMEEDAINGVDFLMRI